MGSGRSTSSQPIAFALPTSSGMSNLGDIVLHETLVRLLRACGVRVWHGSSTTTRHLLWGHAVLVGTAVAASVGRRMRPTLIYPVGQSLTKTFRSLPRVVLQLTYLAALRGLGVRLVVLSRGTQYGAFANKLQEYGLWRLSAYYSARDGDSIASARFSGIRFTAWFPDLSWLVSSQPSQMARSSAVLCFRAADKGQAGMTALLDRVERLVNEAVEAGIADLVLVQHCAGDATMTDAVEARLRGHYGVRRIPGVLTPADVPIVYGRAALVVGNRLHALLFGLQWGAQALAVISANETKVRRQLEDIGIGSHIVDADSDHAAPGIVLRLLPQRDATAKAVERYRQRARVAAWMALLELFRPGDATALGSDDELEELGHGGVDGELFTNAAKSYGGEPAAQLPISG